MYQQTFLRENNTLGIVDPALNAPDSPGYNPVLVPYDLTRGGTTYTWHGRTDIKQLALYGEDQITAGHWLINAGIRGDIYNGLAIQRVAEPRFGVAYNVPKEGNGAARVLCTHTGNAVQREPRAFEPGML